ncbi:MAG TPA: isoprenylcysteine carboxylmethyltransferase family protein [Myxococcota bacterium]|nr:isoprenylcysteine carboxylmethyltransferase family protein [Myxococcota bacterium]
MSFAKKRLRPRLLAVYALAGAALWLSRPTPLSIAAGALPIALGEGLRLWATGHLHKNDSLTVTGPYAYLRHPLYLGTLLIGMGFLVMAWSPVALAVAALFGLFYFGYYIWYKDRIESARLESLYGDAYRRFAAAVPRLIPRLHAYVPLEADRASEQAWRSVRFADNNETGTAAAVAVGVLCMVARWGLL